MIIPRNMDNEMSRKVAAVVVAERELVLADAKYKIANAQYTKHLASIAQK